MTEMALKENVVASANGAAGASPRLDKTLAKELEEAARTLEKKNADWTRHVAALKKLAEAANRGGARHKEYLGVLWRLSKPLVGVIGNLRSTLVKEGCAVFAEIARAYQAEGIRKGTRRWPSKFSVLSHNIVQVCLRQSCVTIKVISESADACARSIISSAAPMGVGNILSLVCNGCDKSNAVHHRLVSVEYIELTLRTWVSTSKPAEGEPANDHTIAWTARMAEVHAAVKAALHDADDAVRRASRTCFWVLNARNPEIADQIMASLDAASQRRLHDARINVELENPKPDSKLQGNGPSMVATPPASDTSNFSPLATPSELGSDGGAGSFRSDTMMSFKTIDGLGIDASNRGSPSTTASSRDKDSPAPLQRAPQQRAPLQRRAQQQQEQVRDSLPDSQRSGAAGQGLKRPLRTGAQRVQKPLGEIPAPHAPQLESSARQYRPDDYADGSTSSLAGRQLRTTPATGGPRLAGAQRVEVMRSSRTGTGAATRGKAASSAASEGRHGTLGAAMRVEPAAKQQKPQYQRTPPAEGAGAGESSSRPRSDTNSSGSASICSSGPTPAALKAHLRELETSPHWSARKDAVEAFMRALIESPNGFPSQFAAKLIPALCKHIGDQAKHHKVAQEVLKCICLMMPKHLKEFGDNLKQLLPALLVGTKDSKVPIRRFSSEAMDLCLENFSHDQLAAVFSELCSERGDSKCLAAMTYLPKVVPTARAFFSNPLHVSQVVRHVDRPLESRKIDMRKAAQDLLITVCRHDQALFLQVLRSSEIPSTVRERALKACKACIKEPDAASEAHGDAARPHPVQPRQRSARHSRSSSITTSRSSSSSPPLKATARQSPRPEATKSRIPSPSQQQRRRADHSTSAAVSSSPSAQPQATARLSQPRPVTKSLRTLSPEAAGAIFSSPPPQAMASPSLPAFSSSSPPHAPASDQEQTGPDAASLMLSDAMAEPPPALARISHRDDATSSTTLDEDQADAAISVITDAMHVGVTNKTPYAIVPEAAGEATSEAVSETVPEAVIESAVEIVLGAANEAVFEAVSETVPEAVSESAVEIIPEAANKVASEAVSETVLGAAIETVREAAHETVDEVANDSPRSESEPEYTYSYSDATTVSGELLDEADDDSVKDSDSLELEGTTQLVDKAHGTDEMEPADRSDQVSLLAESTFETGSESSGMLGSPLSFGGRSQDSEEDGSRMVLFREDLEMLGLSVLFEGQDAVHVDDVVRTFHERLSNYENPGSRAQNLLLQLQISNPRERTSVLEDISYLSRKSKTSPGPDWDIWVPQLAQACVNELRSEDPGLLEQALLSLTSLIRYHPAEFSPSVEPICSALLVFIGQNENPLLHCAAKTALVYACDAADSKRMLPIVLQAFADPPLNCEDACIDMLRVVFERMPPAEVLQVLTQVHPLLMEAHDHKLTRVRKATTFLYVMVNEHCGAGAVVPYTNMLRPEKRGIVEMYIARGLNGCLGGFRQS